ncbi:MAG: ATP-binding protein [Bdellovibrionaceae bacterium]|nr:ATP-binding protein [Bdellovibrionales bacterium]MCB9086449.1 ATP-binding protein [Pseudobdellovibrionaceae bacterium]
MATDIRSSVLLTGGGSHLQGPLGADWVPDLIQAEPQLKEHHYWVVVLVARDQELPLLSRILDELRKDAPETKVILINEGLSITNLKKLINRNHPFKILIGFREDLLPDLVTQALEEFQLTRQNSDLLNLVHDQNERLKKLNKELEVKVEKRQKYLSRARERVLRTNLQVEALHGALLAIHQAQSVSEMERHLNEALAKHLQLSWTRILFSSQSSLLGNDQFSASGSIRVYKAPLHIGKKRSGSICFARPIEKPDFGGDEIDFCNQIAETVALAIDRLKTLEQTRSLKAQWEATFDAIAEPLCITDSQYKVIRMNRAYMISSGRPYNELLGKDCFEALSGRKAPEDVQSGQVQRWEVFPTNDKDRQVWDISQKPLSLRSNPDKVRILFFRNVTDQLRMERQVLEGAKMAELGTIGSSIAHELNNPLGGIMSFLQLIRMDLDPDSEIKEDIEAMEEAARRCKEIVENLLGFARWDGASDSQTFDLGDVITQAVRIMELQTRSQGITLKAQIPEESCQIKGQPSHLSQALRNLLQNSIDAVTEKMIQDPGYPGCIDVRLIAERNSYQINIDDNGPGIPSKDQQKIFNPLYSTKSTGHNPGLGLTVAFTIISDHGGVLEISSQPGTGTSARISLKRPDLKA